MAIGTKSLIFGAHQFILHPITVLLAWANLYGWYSLIKQPQILLCILLHDIGYFGCPEMDGSVGKLHPRLGGEVIRWLLGDYWAEFTYCHSKYYAEIIGKPVSNLYYADKLAFCYQFKWLYILTTTLTGENKEYISILEQYVHNKVKAYTVQSLTSLEAFFYYESIAQVTKRNSLKLASRWYDVIDEKMSRIRKQ